MSRPFGRLRLTKLPPLDPLCTTGVESSIILPSRDTPPGTSGEGGGCPRVCVGKGLLGQGGGVYWSLGVLHVAVRECLVGS
eukprot:1191572-Prorocentrum_minimum.AAC.4